MLVMEYLFPVSIFIILLFSSWDWIWEKKPRRPSWRGWIIFISGAIGLFLGWNQIISDARQNRALLNSIKREGMRLLPSDFQVKLIIWAHGVAILKEGGEYNPPERLDLNMDIDSISVTFFAPHPRENSQLLVHHHNPGNIMLQIFSSRDLAKSHT
jgi:hypothetical protein